MIDRISSRSKQFKRTSIRTHHVITFKNKSADGTAFSIIFAALLLAVNHAELGCSIVTPEIIHLADKHLLFRRKRYNTVFAGFFQTYKSVELIANKSIIALDGGSDVSGFPFPSDFDIIQSGFGTVDLLELFDFGTARKHISEFLFNAFKITNSIFNKVGKMVFYLLDTVGYFPQLFLVLLDIESCDAADRKCKQFVNIFFGHIAEQLFSERSKSIHHLFVLFLHALTLFDAFVDAVFKEYLSQCFGMTQFV